MFDDDESEETEVVAAAHLNDNPEEVSNAPDTVNIAETLNEAPSNNDHSDHNQEEVIESEAVEESDLNTTADDFVEGTIKKVSSDEKKKTKKSSKGKKRKAAESIDSADNEEGSVCTICFEDWSNSGDHRIASLRCGHFFGYSCIEKWLRGSGNSCPNCNEKNTKKDIRVHFVSRLAAIDTSERDRALTELETARTQLRELEMRHTELEVRSKLQQEKIGQLENDNRRYRDRGGELPAPSIMDSVRMSSSQSGKSLKFMFVKKHEICRPSSERDKCCRVMAVSEYQGMIVVSQPSANPLFPGFGSRRFNMLDQKLGNFVGLGREVVRDLAFHPVTPELLLSCGQDKVVRVTNMVSCSEVVKFTTESEVWACDWAAAPPHSQLYLGTKRSQILVHDTLQPLAEPVSLSFPGSERRPVVGVTSVSPAPSHGLPWPGVLALTLGSLWFWEHNTQENTFTPHRLPTPPGKSFWSLSYDQHTRLVLVVCRPGPLSTHLVMELTSTTLDTGNRVVTLNEVMRVEGGSYNARSFLRSCLLLTSKEAGQVMLAYPRGTGAGDIKVVLQEVPTGRIVQELGLGKPVLDIKAASINNIQYLAILGETELSMYRMET